MTRKMRVSACLVAWAGLVMAAAPLAACGGGGGDEAKASNGSGGNSSGIAAVTATTPPTLQTAVEIRVTDNAFEPANVTIKTGQTVKWTWSGANPHSVLVAGFNSGEKTGSGTFERAFTSGAGKFNYQCGVHGTAMAGVITVE